MTYHNYHAVIQRWVDVVEGKTDEPFLWNPNTSVLNGKLFAYGWFELARARRNRRGKVTHYILNGDLLRRIGWGHTGHQPILQNILRQRKHVIIPFSALDEAGVDLDTVQIIGALEERNETINHHTHTFPAGAVWHNEPVYEDRLVTEETEGQWRAAHPWYRGPTLPEWAKSWQVIADWKRVLRAGRSRYGPEITVTTNDDGTTSYRWQTWHHWLGESLIRARVTWQSQSTDDPWGERFIPGQLHHRWAYFLSGFDQQEFPQLYFLAELPPRVKPTSVEEAYEFLKPEPVLLAEQMGRKVTRQGDIFAIETTLTTRALTKQGAVYEKRNGPAVQSPDAGWVHPARLLGTNHCATEVARMPDGVTLARGSLYHDPFSRDADHVRRRMGDGKAWHIIVKNTVPNTTGRR